jgi:hypothetical protein
VALCELPLRAAGVILRPTPTESGEGTTLGTGTVQVLEKGGRTRDHAAVFARIRVKDGAQAGLVGWIAWDLDRFRENCPGV